MIKSEICQQIVLYLLYVSKNIKYQILNVPKPYKQTQYRCIALVLACPLTNYFSQSYFMASHCQSAILSLAHVLTFP